MRLLDEPVSLIVVLQNEFFIGNFALGVQFFSDLFQFLNMVSFQHFHLLFSLCHVDLDSIVDFLFFLQFFFHVFEFFLLHDHLTWFKFDAFIFLIES